MKVRKTVGMEGMELRPALEDILTKLYLKVPALAFEAFAFGHESNKASTPNPQIYQVEVFHGNEKVGTVSVQFGNYGRTQEQCEIYTIQSPRIKNSIAPHRARITKLPAQALKAAIKCFSNAPSSVEIAEDILSKSSHSIASLHYSAKRQPERIGEEYTLALMQIATAAYHGEPVNQFISKIDALMKKPNLMNMIDTALIFDSVADCYENKSGVVIAEQRDETLLVVSLVDRDSSVARNTYELPELYQTKLAMLRMLDFAQPVQSIGVKLKTNTERTLYYMTGEEIITTS
jgi:hypothetical protein